MKRTIVFLQQAVKRLTVREIIVIGGGAAGFFAAIHCAELLGENGRVRILEKGPDILTKVRISGGGRCNVTHACESARTLTGFYPRGSRSLMGTFSRWGTDDTVKWFESRGVELKTESDGRMFPTTDDSQTIVDCLLDAAREAGVTFQTRCGVEGIRRGKDGKLRVLTDSEEIPADAVLVATGGTRSKDATRPVEPFAQTFEPAVPSLFTFKINDRRLTDLMGLSVADASVKIGKLQTTGPILITHWGLSGPAILKASAWGARDLATDDYNFTLDINWLRHRSEDEARRIFANERTTHGKRKVSINCPFPELPKRLWERLCLVSKVDEDQQWSTLSKDQTRRICRELFAGHFHCTGKSLNKDEFVTCGGVPLKDVNLKTMESKSITGIYYAGEILDIDGVTGGYNFQAAWATGRIAAEGMAG